MVYPALFGENREETGRAVLGELFEEGGKKETGEVARGRIYARTAQWEV